MPFLYKFNSHRILYGGINETENLRKYKRHLNYIKCKYNLHLKHKGAARYVIDYLLYSIFKYN